MRPQCRAERGGAQRARGVGKCSLGLGLVALLGGSRGVCGFVLPGRLAPARGAASCPLRDGPAPVSTRQREWTVLRLASGTAVKEPKAPAASTKAQGRAELLAALRSAPTDAEVLKLLGQLEASEEELSLRDYTVMLGAVKKLKDWKKALELLDSLRGRGLQPNEITYNAVMGVCASAGRYKEAVDILRTMQTTGLLPDAVTYGALMIAFVRGGQWEKALDVMSQMRAARLELTEGVYTAAIMAYEKGGLWVNALEILREMHLKGIRPTLFAYNAAIFSCQKDRQWVQAIALLGEMRQDGLTPDRVSFHGAMGACEEAGKWEGVMDLFEEMRQLSPLDPSRQSYEFVTRAVRGYMKASGPKHAERVREFLKRNNISDKILEDDTQTPAASAGPSPNNESEADVQKLTGAKVVEDRPAVVVEPMEAKPMWSSLEEELEDF